MTIELRPLLDFELQESINVINLGFSGYFVHIELTQAAFLNMIRTDGIDMGWSRMIHLDGQAVGAALIARRGWTSRLAAMCLSPASRGRGAGRAVMDLLLAEAATRGDRSMVLEVIKQNAPAVRLYESCGFKIDRRLFSFEGTSTEAVESPNLQETDIREVARLVTIHGLENLPWQISGESLAQINPPSQAYRLGEALIVISNPAADQIAIRSILVQLESRRQGQAKRLIQALIARFPGKNWIIPALFPEEIAGFLERVGFKRGDLSQYQMSSEINHV